jgi:hypothetical protein
LKIRKKEKIMNFTVTLADERVLSLEDLEDFGGESCLSFEDFVEQVEVSGYFPADWEVNFCETSYYDGRRIFLA